MLPRIIDRQQIKNGSRWSDYQRLGHFTLKGRLSADGRLEVGKQWAKFSNRGAQAYLLEMNAGFPVKIFFPSDRCTVEFLKITDNRTGQQVDVHSGKIKSEVFAGFQDHTLEVRYDGGGHLNIGGGKPWITGEPPAKSRPWAKLPGGENKKARVLVIDGIVREAITPEARQPEIFSLVWRKSLGRYTTSFWGGMMAEEFAGLNEDYELHRVTLSAGGVLNLGGHDHLMTFGKRAQGMTVDITDIRNPSGREPFLVSGRLRETGEVVNQTLIYSVAAGAPENSFERGELIKILQKAFNQHVPELKGTCLITNAWTDSCGVLSVGGYWGRFTNFPDAQVEGKVINGMPAYVRFMSDRQGQPIHDHHGQPLILALNGKTRRQISQQTDLYLARKTTQAQGLLVLIEQFYRTGQLGRAVKRLIRAEEFCRANHVTDQAIRRRLEEIGRDCQAGIAVRIRKPKVTAAKAKPGPKPVPKPDTENLDNEQLRTRSLARIAINKNLELSRELIRRSGYAEALKLLGEAKGRAKDNELTELGAKVQKLLLQTRTAYLRQKIRTLTT
jgi:hypothetical protein